MLRVAVMLLASSLSALAGTEMLWIFWHRKGAWACIACVTAGIVINGPDAVHSLVGPTAPRVPPHLPGEQLKPTAPRVLNTSG